MRPYECASLPRRTMHPRRPVGGVVIFAAQVVVVHPRGGRVCVSTPVGLHLSVNAASLPSVPSVALRSPILPVAGRDGNNRTGSSNDPKGAFRRVPAVDGFQPSAVWYRQRAASMCPRYCLLRVLSRGGPVRVAMLLVSWPFLRGRHAADMRDDAAGTPAISPSVLRVQGGHGGFGREKPWISGSLLRWRWRCPFACSAMTRQPARRHPVRMPENRVQLSADEHC